MQNRPPNRGGVSEEEHERRCLRGTKAESCVIDYLRRMGVECEPGPEVTGKDGMTRNRDVIVGGRITVDVKSTVIGVPTVPLAQCKDGLDGFYAFVIIEGHSSRFAGWLTKREFWATADTVMAGQVIPGTAKPSGYNCKALPEKRMRAPPELVDELQHQ